MIAPTKGYNGHTATEADVEEQPLGGLFQELARDTGNLIALELDLAKAEMSEKASQTGKDVGTMAAGGFVLYAGFLAILLAIILGLSNFIAPWLAALIVGVVVAVIGYIVLRMGMSQLKRRSLVPEQTLASLKEDKQWVQDQAK